MTVSVRKVPNTIRPYNARRRFACKKSHNNNDLLVFSTMNRISKPRYYKKTFDKSSIPCKNIQATVLPRQTTINGMQNGYPYVSPLIKHANSSQNEIIPPRSPAAFTESVWAPHNTTTFLIDCHGNDEEFDFEQATQLQQFGSMEDLMDSSSLRLLLGASSSADSQPQAAN
eukprot:GEZU01012814.1.p1 GENE.GEZU01012814.1~~GEZU01012814.1.p1  ORF type:complete len:171 (-),score=50.40 GEZU01012814.1:565-1077(-)